MANSMIPNSFQHPNLYIDRLAYFLTPQENVVLTKAVREILGWQETIEDQTGTVSISLFVEGKWKRGRPRTEENHLAYGCGLGAHAVRKALKALVDYGILKKVGEPTQAGQTYKIQIDKDAINWAGLEARREEWNNANDQRTQSATRTRLAKRRREQGVTSDIRGNVTRNPLRDTSGVGVTSHVTVGVTSHVTQRNPEKPRETHDHAANAASPSSPTRTQPKSKLHPNTPQAHRMFERLNANANAKGRKGPQRFASLESKAKFDGAVERLDSHFDQALQTALEQGCNTPTRVTNYIAKYEVKSEEVNDSRAGLPVYE